jgi:hypothetical protein
MKTSTKWIIGGSAVVVIGVAAYLTRNMWMHKSKKDKKDIKGEKKIVQDNIKQGTSVSKEPIKSKYIFTKDYSDKFFTFKKGDTVEGTMVRNNRTSEPPNFIEVNTPEGTLALGYGGRGNSVLEIVK